MRRLAFIALVAGVVINTPAVAQEPGYKALVEVTSHQVSVNRDGTGYRQVDGITPVDPGDLVMASARAAMGGLSTLIATSKFFLAGSILSKIAMGWSRLAMPKSIGQSARGRSPGGSLPRLLLRCLF